MDLEKIVIDYGDKYNFYYLDNGTIICTTYYKGKLVRGIAKCSPDDTFDINVGRRLAYLRCKAKYMKVKCKHAENVFSSTLKVYLKAQKDLKKANAFSSDALAEFGQARLDLQAYEKTFDLFDL
jgi:hypothetical protein